MDTTTAGNARRGGADCPKVENMNLVERLIVYGFIFILFPLAVRSAIQARIDVAEAHYEEGNTLKDWGRYVR